jgi:hypothetical protein
MLERLAWYRGGYGTVTLSNVFFTPYLHISTYLVDNKIFFF